MEGEKRSHLGGLASGLGPPQRAGAAGLRRGRRRRRVRRRCVRRRRRVQGDRIRRAALAGAALPVAGDGGEVHAQADAHRLLGLPPHPLHCSLHGTHAAADSTRSAPARGRLPGRWAEGKGRFEGEGEPPLESGGGGGWGRGCGGVQAFGLTSAARETEEAEYHAGPEAQREVVESTGATHRGPGTQRQQKDAPRRASTPVPPRVETA